MPLNDAPDTLKRLNVFIKGANKLFWLDLESSTKRFYAIYLVGAAVNVTVQSPVLIDAARQYLKALLSHAEQWTASMTSVALELFDLVSKFYFYYEHVDSLHAFLATMQHNFDAHVSQLKLPPSHTKINTLNMFANELVRHLRLMKSESALVQYLGRLNGDTCQTATNRAQSTARRWVRSRDKRRARGSKSCCSTTRPRAAPCTPRARCVNGPNTRSISSSPRVAGLATQSTSCSASFIPFTHPNRS